MSVAASSQLMVTVPNRAGQLARVLGVVAQARVNVLDCAGYAGGAEACILLVTSNNAKVMTALRRIGYEVRKDKVVLVTGKDAVGQGARILKKVADAKINLRLVHAAGTGRRYLIVLKAAHAHRLAAAVRK